MTAPHGATIGDSQFDRATAVGADGAASIHAGWDIAGNANGGYLLALAGRGLAAVAGRPDPITITGHYLAPGTAGPVTVTGSLVKAGRRFATVTGTLSRDGRPMLQVLATFGDLGRPDPAVRDPAGHDPAGRDAFEHVGAAPPDLPPFAELADVPRSGGGFRPALNDWLVMRMRPGDVGFAIGQPTGVAEMAGYLGFADGRPVDPLALLLMCDAMPPALFNLGGPVGWAPTVEYTVHVRGVPAPGPLRCVFRTHFLTGGFLEEDGEAWDSDGRLVALSRQLGLVPRS